MKIAQIVSSFLIIACLIYIFSHRDHNTSSQKILSYPAKVERVSIESDSSESERVNAIEENIEIGWGNQDFDTVNDSFENWMEFDPEEALSYVARMEYPMEPLQFSSQIKAYLETLSPLQAMERSLKLRNDDLQESVTADLFSKWLKDDFKSSKSWLLENSEKSFVLILAERMGRLGNLGEPKEALEWIFEIPEDELRSKLVKGVVLRWLRVDGSEAVAHLNSLPASPDFDESATDYATELSEKNPVIAMVWANTIENENLRSMVVSQIQLGWNEDLEKEYQELLETGE